MNPVRSIVVGVVGAVALIIISIMFAKGAVDVDPGEIQLCVDPWDGEQHTFVQQGLFVENFPNCTAFKKSFQFSFDPKDGEIHQPIKVSFNDGGHAFLHGSVRVDLPLDEQNLWEVRTRYGSQDALEQQLVRTVVAKAIYMTGPLMTSKESIAEKRNELINLIEDQAQGGVYKTVVRDIKTKDPLSGEEKTVSVTEIQRDKDGNALRQEKSPLEELGIRISNFSPTLIDYDDRVEAQIQTQQQATMQVQTAIANAKKAEQDAITTEQQGRADAAKARWEQETINAKEIAEAQKSLEVARLAAQRAEQYKREQVLIGEGDGARKRAEMVANGALEQKLEAYIKVQEAWAAAFAKRTGNVVPEVVVGGSGGATNNAQLMMELLSIKAAKDLALDVKATK